MHRGRKYPALAGQIFITRISATHVGPEIGQKSRGYYISVELNGRTTKTSTQPVLAGMGVVEWDVEILLPSKRSTIISFKMYECLEQGTRHGEGVLCCQFKNNIGGVVDSVEELRPIKLKDVSPSFSSLRIVTEGRICGIRKSRTIFGLLELDVIIDVAQLTYSGHCALLRYRHFHQKEYLDGAISYFERVRDLCSPDHLNSSGVLFNLATARFIHCQDNDHYGDLDLPIALYRDALQLGTRNRADPGVTPLDLCFGVLAYLQRVDETGSKGWLAGVMKNYGYRVAWLALQMAGLSVSIPLTELGISRANRPPLDGDEMICWMRTELSRFSDSDPRKPSVILSLGRSLADRTRKNGDIADISEAILMFRNALRLTPDGDPQASSLFLTMLGNTLSLRFQCFGDVADIQESISVLENSLRFTDDSITKTASLLTLASSLFHRFQRLGELKDIDRSISMFEDALDHIPDSHPNKPVALNGLGDSLRLRFEHFDDPADISRSISVLEDAIRLDPVSEPTELTSLGNSLMIRFERLGDVADISRSISVLEEALCLTPLAHPHKPARLSSLGLSLLRRFRILDNLADLNNAIPMLEEAVHLIPDGHPDKSTHLHNLGLSLSDQFERLGDLEALKKSILLEKEAVRLIPDDHRDKPVWLSTLGGLLRSLFEHFSDPVDISMSISMIEEALHLTRNNHPDRPDQLNSLANSLTARFEHLGDLADMTRSISLKEEALRLTPNGHPSKSVILGSLGHSLSYRFEQLGDLVDINRSILLGEEALRLTLDGNPNKPLLLGKLASSLHLRFEHLGDLVDITQSILLTEEALNLTPDGHPHKPGLLANLGNSLFDRFKRLGDPADFAMSVSMQEEALRLIPNVHPDKPRLLSNFSKISLVDAGYIDKSILRLEEALHLTPDGHPRKIARLNNLGTLFLHRFERLGDIADINKSISMFGDALRLTPRDHPDKPQWLCNLGNAFTHHLEHSQDPSSLSAAIFHFSEAARSTTGPIFYRFYAARGWIRSAQRQEKTQALLDAYATAIKLLPELAWLGLPLAERHRVLSEAADTARDAAAAAIETGCPEMAVEWLEQGRSIVWSQFLQLRTPVDELAVKHPVLARQFQQISLELERVSSRDHAASSRLADKLVSGGGSLEEQVQRHHHLALNRERLLTEIRSLPSFQSFLLPRTVGELASFVHSGPVVYLNASRQRCDALVIKPESGTAITVPLPGVDYREMEVLQSMLRLVLEHNHLIFSRDDIFSELAPSADRISSRLFVDSLLEGDVLEADGRAVKTKPQRIGGYTTDEIFQRILAYLWSNVVRPVLEVLGLSTPWPRYQKMPHIFWCPTGPLSFLPIHAAGLHDAAGASAKLSDFAISSYLPTITSLSTSAPSAPSLNIRLVAVPQPPTDGQSVLGSVMEEINHIKALSAKSPFVTVQDSCGTVEDVMKKVKDADWVHFACHGVQDPQNPLDSGLCLANERRLRLSDIIRLSRPHGGLAFLSACQTAQGDEKLAEESVHLAAGMLLAGYGGVIATMWAIKDPDAPKVTRDVYAHLFRDGKVPDCTKAAEALHYAVQHLRDSGASFSSWVPFIHVGR